MELEIVADGLRFPEGPVVMPDGSVILVEIAAGRITRVRPDGSKETVAEPGGGPNGLAMGPDGKLYCCNNGGFNYLEHPAGLLIPHGQADDYSGGGSSGSTSPPARWRRSTRMAISAAHCAGPTTSCSMGRAASGSATTARTGRASGISPAFSTPAPMAAIWRKSSSPAENPNGIGLSPDGKSLYAAETYTCRLMKFVVTAPGMIDETVGLGGPGIPLHRPAGYKFFDSLAVEAGAISAWRPSERVGSA